ncbi:hypothetical protein T484DRAFT_2027846, partial [Baffinella frigidus]
PGASSFCLPPPLVEATSSSPTASSERPTSGEICQHGEHCRARLASATAGTRVHGVPDAPESSRACPVPAVPRQPARLPRARRRFSGAHALVGNEADKGARGRGGRREPCARQLHGRERHPRLHPHPPLRDSHWRVVRLPQPREIHLRAHPRGGRRRRRRDPGEGARGRDAAGERRRPGHVPL